jgi:hypothetical protein
MEAPTRSTAGRSAAGLDDDQTDQCFRNLGHVPRESRLSTRLRAPSKVSACILAKLTEYLPERSTSCLILLTYLFYCLHHPTSSPTPQVEGRFLSSTREYLRPQNCLVTPCHSSRYYRDRESLRERIRLSSSSRQSTEY